MLFSLIVVYPMHTIVVHSVMQNSLKVLLPGAIFMPSGSFLYTTYEKPIIVHNLVFVLHINIATNFRTFHNSKESIPVAKPLPSNF